MRLFKQLLKWAAEFLLAGLLGCMLLFLLAEWMSGCGETYVDAKGVRRMNTCFFIGGDRQ
jgi:hypothetical protein